MNNQKGFTLIEMLVVIAIVGLLSSVVVVGLTGAREKARDARRLADIRGMQNSLELNYGATGYPSATTGFDFIGTDPLGATTAYAYLAVDAIPTDSFYESYKLGVCVESDGNKLSTEEVASLCPTLTCGGQYAGKFCVIPQ